MPAQVLVMCPECGRPQPGGSEACIACGARLPPALPPSGRDQVLDAFSPFLEADLGRGRVLTLSKRRLEWRSGYEGDAQVFELSELKSLELSRRPSDLSSDSSNT